MKPHNVTDLECLSFSLQNYPSSPSSQESETWHHTKLLKLDPKFISVLKLKVVFVLCIQNVIKKRVHILKVHWQ